MDAEEKIKHLEFIQNNIERMNQCSFQMKGWMLTVVSALLALYAASISDCLKVGNKIYLAVAFFPTVLFWMLDSYYLQQERKFIGIYQDVIENSDKVKLFAMPLDNYSGGKYSYVSSLLSKTIAPVYLLVVVGLIIALVIL